MTGRRSCSTDSGSELELASPATSKTPTLADMRDPDVRRLLHSHLSAKYVGADDTLVVDELGVRSGSCRIDVAVINAQLTGWEIKAPKDRLDRLPTQVQYYGEVCDQAWLVTDQVHLESAAAIIPSWWGIMRLEQSPHDVARLRLERPAGSNPQVIPAALAQLLWRAEALQILARFGAHSVSTQRLTRPGLWQCLVETVPPRELADQVRASLRGRNAWRGADRPAARSRARKTRPFEVLSSA